MADPMMLLEIEERLYADKTGELRKSMLDQLLKLQNALNTRRRLLNDRKSYLEIQAALQAVTAAITVMRTVFVDTR
jgi:nitrogen fixation/metabolism regulation signal transduction histidine kinase